MRHGMLLLGLALVAGCQGSRQQHDPGEEAAIVKVEQLEGRVHYDEGRQGMIPVVKVDYSGTYVGDDALVPLKSFTQLEEVDLAGTRVTDRGLQHLKSVPSLKRLRVHRTRLSSEGLQELQRALPQLVIVR